jgi:predicted helicase
MKRKAKIYYTALDDFWRKEEKLAWLRDNPIEKIAFESITPDEKHNWINQADTDFETLLPLIDKDVKLGKKEEAIFKIYSTGYLTGRDEWIIDEDKDNLSKKMSEYIKIYNKSSSKNLDATIKWSRNLQSRKQKGMSEKFNKDSIIKTSYRPFINKLISMVRTELSGNDRIIP